MYAVLYSDETESWIKIYNHLHEAHTAARNAVCGCGFKAKVFEFDMTSSEFVEMYDVD